MPITINVDEKTGKKSYDYTPLIQDRPSEPTKPEDNDVIDGGSITPETEEDSPSLLENIQESINNLNEGYDKALSGPGVIPSVLRVGENALRGIVQETSDAITKDIPAKFGLGEGTTAENPDAPLFWGLGGAPLKQIPTTGAAEDLLTGFVQAGIGYLSLRGPVLALMKAAAPIVSSLPGAVKIAGTVEKVRRAKGLGGVAGRVVLDQTVGAGAVTGALTDVFVFEPHDGRLADLIDQVWQNSENTPLAGPVLEYLQADPNDSGADGRLKNALEGVLAGGALGTTFATIRLAAKSRRLLNYLDTLSPGKKLNKQQIKTRQLLEGEVLRAEEDLAEAGAIDADKADMATEIETAITRSEGIEKAIDPEVLPPTETGPTKPKKISEVLRENLRALAQSDARQLRAIDAELKGFSQAMDDVESPKPKEAASLQPVDEIKAIETELEGLKKPVVGDRSKEAKRYRSLRRKLVKLQKEQKNIAKANEEFPPRIVAEETLEDTRGKGEFYHGAAGEFELDSSSHYRAQNLYGAGFYTTDDLITAKKYQKKNKKRVEENAKRTVYKITEKQPVKFFDLDQPVPQDIIEKLEEIQAISEGHSEVIGRTFDTFNIGSWNKSTGKNPSLAEIIDEMRLNNKANENISAAELDINMITDIEEFLRGKGFGGFTHQGGKLIGKGKRLHQVKIYWDPNEQLNLTNLETIRQQILEEPKVPEAPKAPPVGEDLPLEVRERYLAELRQYNIDMDKWEASQGSPPPPPEPPTGVQPTPPDDDWGYQLADQIAANRDRIESGDMDLRDLMENNVLKVQSPSGKKKYVPSVLPADEARRAQSDLLSRPDATGVPYLSFKERRNQALKRWHEEGIDAKKIDKNLEELSGNLSDYEKNLDSLLDAMALSDNDNFAAGIAANKWLNRAADPSIDPNKLAAEMLSAAENAKRSNNSVSRIYRLLGQYLASAQIPRVEPGSFDSNLKLKRIDIDDEIAKGYSENTPTSVADSVGLMVSDQVREAALSGDFGDIQVRADLDGLARELSQNKATRSQARGWWDKVGDQTNLGLRGLAMYRAGQLLSSGATFWRTLIGNTYRAVTLPITQAMGAAVDLDARGISEGFEMYGQYIYNIQNSLRLGIESFKVGRGLYDIDRTHLDIFDKAIAAGEKAPSLDTPQGEWTLNTVPWIDIQDKSIGAIAQKRIWQALNLATRLQVSEDTMFKAMVGQAFEFTNNLRPGLDDAASRGIDPKSPEGIAHARKYADAAVKASLRDATVNGQTILDAVMDSPHAQKAMRWATFTDDIWARMDTQTVQRGLERGKLEGLEGDALQTFAENWAKTEQEMLPIARTFSLIPRVWQNWINASPVFSFIQPFNRTPGDIIKSAARMTPGANFFVDTWWRDINSPDKMTRQRAKGDVAVGATSIILALTAMNSGEWEFTGGGPSNPRARKKWYEIEGKIPYAARRKQGEDENGNPIWGDWVTYSSFEPISTIVGALGDYSELANKLPTEAKERLGSSLVLSLITNVAQGQLGKTYYQGFQEFHDALLGTFNDVDYGPNRRNPLVRYLSSFSASLVPGSAFLRGGRRLADPYVRSKPAGATGNVGMDFFYETYNEIKNSIAGWNEDLPPRLNWVTGEPQILTGIPGDQWIPFEAPWMGYLFQLSPSSGFARKASEQDPVLNEMARLHGRGANFMGPSENDFSQTGDRRNRLDVYEMDTWVTLNATIKHPTTGLTLREALLAKINSQNYQDIPITSPSEKYIQARAAALNTIINQYRGFAREIFIGVDPRTGEAITPAAARIVDNLKETGQINKATNYRLKYGHAPGLPPSNPINTDLVPR